MATTIWKVSVRIEFLLQFSKFMVFRRVTPMQFGHDQSFNDLSIINYAPTLIKEENDYGHYCSAGTQMWWQSQRISNQSHLQNHSIILDF